MHLGLDKPMDPPPPVITLGGSVDLQNARQQGFGSVAAGTGQIAETSVAYHDRIARETAFLNAVWSKQPHVVAGMIVRFCLKRGQLQPHRCCLSCPPSPIKRSAGDTADTVGSMGRVDRPLTRLA